MIFTKVPLGFNNVTLYDFAIYLIIHSFYKNEMFIKYGALQLP